LHTPGVKHVIQTRSHLCGTLTFNPHWLIAGQIISNPKFLTPIAVLLSRQYIDVSVYHNYKTFVKQTTCLIGYILSNNWIVIDLWAFFKNKHWTTISGLNTRKPFVKVIMEWKTLNLYGKRCSFCRVSMCDILRKKTHNCSVCNHESL
jgi:hypothetical protein